MRDTLELVIDEQLRAHQHKPSSISEREMSIERRGQGRLRDLHTTCESGDDP
jgi:hypothetical protein